MNLPDILTDDVGEILITGHRIGLYTVVRHYLEGADENWIATEYPSLPLDLVRHVLAFYRANREEVDTYVKHYRADLERMEAAYIPGPGVLKLRHQLEVLRQADSERVLDPMWQSLPVGEKLRRLGLLDSVPKQ